MKKFIVINFLFSLALIGVFGIILKNLNTPVKQVKFHDMELLVPSYACSETRIVMDAATLNSFSLESWSSDEEIDSIYHSYNKQGLLLTMGFNEYYQFLIEEGYGPDAAAELCLVDFGLKTSTDFYQAIRED